MYPVSRNQHDERCPGRWASDDAAARGLKSRTHGFTLNPRADHLLEAWVVDASRRAVGHAVSRKGLRVRVDPQPDET